jgi:F-type H+-transporting ATPase subunit a
MFFWVPIALPMYALGTLVVIVQTMVFCLLSTVYIAMAIEHTEH